MQSEEVKEKLRESVREVYGVDYYFQSKDFQEKSKETCLKKYGTRNVFQSRYVKEKIKQTSLERYGVENPMQSEEVKTRLKEVFIEKYGVENPFQSEILMAKSKETSLKRYGVEHPSQSDIVKNRVSETCMERYGVPSACMRSECRSASSNDSSANKEFASLLELSNVYYEREFHIGYYSYDFKVNNTLIEIDPFPYHNSLWGPFGKCKSEDYHQKKSQTAIDNGYSCIHVFDWDDKSKIIDLLKPRERLYARNLTVFGIDNQECREYLNQYHLQGTCNGQSIRLGLRDRFGNLISLMTFGKPRYNKNYQYELLRYCTTANVIGGAEKLFKHFIKEFNPESIISYCDRSKFRGDVYSKLGFKLLSDSRPSKHWYSPNTYERMQHITDNFLRQRGYDQIFDADFGKGTSNEELIIARGYLPIFDCGQSTYIWSSK